MIATAFPHRLEAEARIDVPAAALFERLDDHRNLSAHMERSSWMMLGSRMELRLDAAGGRAIGSRIRLAGRVLGIPLAVEEAVTERTPPTRKVWETLGAPRLLVVGPYRMGFEIEPASAQVRLRVFIEYALPDGPTRWLGRVLARPYARWCVERMVKDAARHFASPPPNPKPLGAG